MKEWVKSTAGKLIVDIVFGLIAAVFVWLIADKVLVPFIFDIAKTAAEAAATLAIGAERAAEMSRDLTWENISGIGGTIIRVLKALKPHITFAVLFGIRFIVAYISGSYKYGKEVLNDR